MISGNKNEGNIGGFYKKKKKKKLINVTKIFIWLVQLRRYLQDVFHVNPKMSKSIAGELVHEIKNYCQSSLQHLLPGVSFLSSVAWQALWSLEKHKQRVRHPCSLALVLRIPGPGCLRLCGTHFGEKIPPDALRKELSSSFLDKAEMLTPVKC